MFGKFFGAGKKAKAAEVSSRDMEFIGEPSGAGLTELRIEMTKFETRLNGQHRTS